MLRRPLLFIENVEIYEASRLNDESLRFGIIAKIVVATLRECLPYVRRMRSAFVFVRTRRPLATPPTKPSAGFHGIRARPGATFARGRRAGGLRKAGRDRRVALSGDRAGGGAGVAPPICEGVERFASSSLPLIQRKSPIGSSVLKRESRSF